LTITWHLSRRCRNDQGGAAKRTIDRHTCGTIIHRNALVAFWAGKFHFGHKVEERWMETGRRGAVRNQLTPSRLKVKAEYSNRKGQVDVPLARR
jgi:hypothetical protein